MTNAGFNPIRSVTATDENGQVSTVQVASEISLTLLMNEEKIVTLMTLGTHPKALAIGYLRNQRLIKEMPEIQSIHVNWENGTIQVNTFAGEKTRRAVTAGCGQGVVLSLNQLHDIHRLKLNIQQTLIDALLHTLTQQNEIHRQAGGVHSCALCQGSEIIAFVEDVGRHNAVDTIAGLMWLHNWPGDNKIFYTTGRLTSEMVMKVANLGISVLLSRSGVTYKGIQNAQEIGMTLIAHAKGQQFLIFSGEKNVVFDG